MKFVSRATEWVRTQGQKDTAMSHAIQFIYRVFANRYIQSITSILGTIIISFLIGIQSFGIFFWICIILYCLSTILIAWANEHIRGKVRDVQAFQHALYGMGTSLRSWALSMERATKLLKKGSISAKKCNLENLNIDFEAAACLVCETLCSSLSRNGEKDDVFVTLYERMEDDECKIIAHSLNHEQNTPDYEHAIPKPCDSIASGEIADPPYVFYPGKKEIIALHNHDLVMEAFGSNGDYREFVRDIQQYIRIPIVIQMSGIMFLLQVHTNVPNFFGNNKKAVKDFAKNIIYHYAQLLRMMYEQSCVVNEIISYIRGKWL